MNIESSKKLKKQNFVILIFIFIFEAISNAFRDNGSHAFDTIKFLILLIGITVFLIEIVFNHIQVNYLKSETKIIILWYLSLLAISIFWMIRNNTWNNGPLITGGLRILVPIVFSFLIINLLSKEQLYKALYIFLLVSFVTFLVNEIITNRFSFGEIFTLSLTNSTGSQMESNFFSPTAISLCCYFGYFRKNKFPLILSTIFAILTYKRLMAFFAIFLLLFGGILKNKKVNLWIKIISGIIFFFLTVWYIRLNLGEANSNFIFNVFGKTMNQFTMGRTWLFKNIYLMNIPKSGLFSLLNLPYRSPEMDFPDMFLEMGYSGIIVSIIALLTLVKNSLYNFVIIIFVLFEILTSHFFDITFFWIVLYITIGLINQIDVNYKKNFDNIKQNSSW